MNPFTGQFFSAESMQLIALETVKIVVVTALAVFLARPAGWKRNLWHAGAFTLLLLCVVEYSGVGRQISDRVRQDAWMFTAPDGPAPPPAASSGRTAWLPWLSAVWFGGSLLFAGRLLFARRLLRRIVQRAQPCLNPSLLAATDRLRRRLDIDSPVLLLVSGDIAVPIATGVWQRAVLIPKDFETRFAAGEQESIISHELGHHRAGDPFWSVLMNVLLAALWWNPLVWWLHRQATRHAELAADEASALLPRGPELLAASLVKMGRHLSNVTGTAGATGFGRSSELAARVRRMLKLDGVQLPPPSLLATLTVKVACPLALTFFAVICFR